MGVEFESLSLVPCNACGGTYFYGWKYLPARKRRRVWYAPWRWTDARPAAVRNVCARCHKTHYDRPGTIVTGPSVRVPG